MGEWQHNMHSKHLLCLPFLSRAHQSRQHLDRRRFEAAHLKYACLQTATWYPDAISYKLIVVEGEIGDSLNKITPILFNRFEKEYAD